MPLNLALVLRAVLEEYTLPWDGFHGLAHWARVLENGRRLAPLTGALIEVVELFAVLHDCQRVSEGEDPDHGQRRPSSVVSSTASSSTFPIANSGYFTERAGRTHEHTHRDVTIQTCWDADRLDLGRVGVTRIRNSSAPKLQRDRRRFGGQTKGDDGRHPRIGEK